MSIIGCPYGPFKLRRANALLFCRKGAARNNRHIRQAIDKPLTLAAAAVKLNRCCR
jgi:hypothetical protein